MSDVMLYGVLRMPYEMAMDDELSKYQFYQRAQQAVEELDKARGEVVSVFSHDYPPSFRQGAPEHELEEAVTAEYCRGLVSKIMELSSMLTASHAREQQLIEAIRESEDTVNQLGKENEALSKDRARLDFITSGPWQVQWDVSHKAKRYRMMKDGWVWGQWYKSARSAIDVVMQRESASVDQKGT